MKKLTFTLLILGLLFSQIFIFTFNLNDGFVYHGFSIKLLPLADYAGKSSPVTQLTSVILGYLLFIFFGVINTNKVRSPEIFKPALMFSGIAIIVTFFEFTSILEDIQGNYMGKHFKIGWPMFILGIFIYSKKYLAKR